MRFYLVISVLAVAWLPLMANLGVAQSAEATWDLPVQEDKNISIGKIFDFLNDPKLTPDGKDPVLKHEFKYFNHGAVTKEQIEARKGHYYIVTFTNDGPAADLVIRMDFRQLLSRDKMNTLEVPYKQVKGSVKQQFVIAGDLYKAYGDVNSWRISVVKDGKIVAQKKSYVW